MATVTPAEFEAHARTHGIPVPLHPEVRAAYERIGQPPPTNTVNATLVVPPDASTGLCCHCGKPAADGLRMLHAVSGYEQSPLRLEVLHCQDCRYSAACDPLQTTPGSGLPEGVSGGFCEPITNTVTLGAEIVPMARFAVRLVRWQIGVIRRFMRSKVALGGLALGVLGFVSLGLVHSQGQQTATLEGTTGAVAVQDATSGHGYNVGSIKLYTGSAPSDANAAETGTVLATVTLPNGIFNGGVSGFPAVATATTISSVTISNTGTAGYGRVLANGDDGLSSTTERRMQITVGTSAADCILNTLSLVSGGTLTVTSFTYTSFS